MRDLIKRINWKFLLIMIIYLGVVAAITLSPFTGEILYEKHYNLIPFRSIQNYQLYLKNHSFTGSFRNSMVAVINLLGNLFLLFPFGFLLPLCFPGKVKMKHAVGYAFLISMTIEILQFFFLRSRIADIDDVIFNTLSALIGYILYRIICFRHYRFHKRRQRPGKYFPDARRRRSKGTGYNG